MKIYYCYSPILAIPISYTFKSRHTAIHVLYPYLSKARLGSGAGLAPWLSPGEGPSMKHNQGEQEQEQKREKGAPLSFQL